jgi:hypothetical protein
LSDGTGRLAVADRRPDDLSQSSRSLLFTKAGQDDTKAQSESDGKCLLEKEPGEVNFKAPGVKIHIGKTGKWYLAKR